MRSFISNPPDAASLMTSARSFGNYDLAGAIADLIDNSIKAKARNIKLSCEFNDGQPVVRVLDDGYGMDANTLLVAMRPASANPRQNRSPDDLGRFGWGMKSASFSQCMLLTVLSRRSGQLCGAEWNLEDIDNWKMGIYTESEAAKICDPEILRRDGTEIVWRNCDRLSENGTLDREHFNALIAHAQRRLALVFHRFISGDANQKPLTIEMNGRAVPRFDPFYRDHPATQALPPESIRLDSESIEIRPYILPHYSKLKSTELETLAGDDGLIRNQGFYVYRNCRLILHGTWFRLAQFGELSQLIRIGIDIPNSLDHLWKLTIDKTDAQLPSVMRTRLRQLIASLRARSSRVHRIKGGTLTPRGPTPVWNRLAASGDIRYRINRDHPLVDALFAPEEEEERNNAVGAALAAIEQGLPISSLGADLASNPASVHQTIGNAADFKEMLLAALPPLLASSGSVDALRTTLRSIEPFSSHWTFVEEFLVEEGWVDDAK